MRKIFIITLLVMGTVGTVSAQDSLYYQFSETDYLTEGFVDSYDADGDNSTPSGSFTAGNAPTRVYDTIGTTPVYAADFGSVSGAISGVPLNFTDSSMTTMLWFKLQASVTSGNVPFLTFEEYLFGIFNTDRVIVWNVGVPENGFLTTAQSTLPLDTWIHIAYTLDIDEDSTIIYLNGVESARKFIAKSNEFTVETTASISSDIDARVDELKIFNRVLSPAEILAHASSSVITSSNDVNEALASSIQAYPNPASDELTISSSQLTENVSFSLVNTLGVEIDIAANQLSATEYSFDIASLEKGMYILKVITDNGFGIKTIIKE